MNPERHNVDYTAKELPVPALGRAASVVYVASDQRSRGTEPNAFLLRPPRERRPLPLGHRETVEWLGVEPIAASRRQLE